MNNNKKKVLIVTEPLKRDEKGPLESYVIENGARVIHQPNSELSYIKSYKFYKKIMKSEHYDIVHSHLLFYSGFVLKAAYKCGIPKRVAHSHFSQPLVLYKSKLRQIIAFFYRIVMRFVLNKYATDLIACGEKPGEFLYGKNVFAKRGILLNNGIDCDRFKYDTQIRESVRKELNIKPNTIVLGHVGKMYYVKNQEFVLDVFNDFLKRYPDSVLILVGDGKDREMLEKKAEFLCISNKVIFTGVRNDVNKLLMAMDCLLFPSIHEGFPVILIEAQATNVDYLSINSPTSYWIESIIKMMKYDRNSIDNSVVINNFDIKNIGKKLEEIYLN